MHQPRAELLLLFNARPRLREISKSAEFGCDFSWIRLDLGQYGDQLTKTTDPWSHKEPTMEVEISHDAMMPHAL